MDLIFHNIIGFVIWALMVMFYGFIYELHKKIAIVLLMFFTVVFIAIGFIAIAEDVPMEFNILENIGSIISGVFTFAWFELGRGFGMAFKDKDEKIEDRLVCI